MKKKSIIAIVSIACLAILLVLWMGIGARPSASAVQDLKAELEAIYGEEYTGKEVENGTEDMEFVVAPKTFFLTNWNLRQALELDYEYECQVVFTTYAGGEIIHTRTITYRGVDPMGAEDARIRAHLIPDSKTETE